MRYLNASKRESDGRWDYTEGRREQGQFFAHPIGFCGDAGGGHHETEDEARACYRRYELDCQLRFSDGATSTSRHRCRAPGCEEWTGGYAELGRSQMFILCDKHRTREVVAQLAGPHAGAAWVS